jgi:hypothetical protein
MELVLLNVQAEYYGPTPQSNTGPGVLGCAYRDVIETQNELGHTIYLGNYRWNIYRFNVWSKQQVIIHKCATCNDPSSADNKQIRVWATGNDYGALHDTKTYYCQDAPSILE